MLGHAAAALERIRNLVRRAAAAGRPVRCRTPEALAALLAREAAFIAQKSTIEYCRARAGCGWDKLFAERELAEAIRRSRWTAYPAVLGDLAEATQILLRRAGEEEAARAVVLAPVIGRALRYHGEPEIPLDLEGVEAAIVRRLEGALAAPPRSMRELGPPTGAIVYEVLPLRTNHRGDREVVQNQVTFLLCGAYGRLEERIATAELARALLAAAGEGAGGPAGFEPATRPL